MRQPALLVDPVLLYPSRRLRRIYCGICALTALVLRYWVWVQIGIDAHDFNVTENGRIWHLAGYFACICAFVLAVIFYWRRLNHGIVALSTDSLGTLYSLLQGQAYYQSTIICPPIVVHAYLIVFSVKILVASETDTAKADATQQNNPDQPLVVAHGDTAKLPHRLLNPLKNLKNLKHLKHLKQFKNIRHGQRHTVCLLSDSISQYDFWRLSCYLLQYNSAA